MLKTIVAQLERINVLVIIFISSVLASSLWNEGGSGRFRDREHRRASAGRAHPRSLLTVAKRHGLIPGPGRSCARACKPA